MERKELSNKCKKMSEIKRQLYAIEGNERLKAIGRSGRKNKKKKPVAHGTLSEYNRGCRCDMCKSANAVRSKSLRAIKKRTTNMIKEASDHSY